MHTCPLPREGPIAGAIMGGATRMGGCSASWLGATPLSSADSVSCRSIFSLSRACLNCSCADRSCIACNHKTLRISLWHGLRIGCFMKSGLIGTLHEHILAVSSMHWSPSGNMAPSMCNELQQSYLKALNITLRMV